MRLRAKLQNAELSNSFLEHCFIFNTVGESSSWRGRRNATERSETEEVSCPISGFHLCYLCLGEWGGVEKINEATGDSAKFTPNDRLRENAGVGLGCSLALVPKY